MQTLAGLDWLDLNQAGSTIMLSLPASILSSLLIELRLQDPGIVVAVSDPTLAYSTGRTAMMAGLHLPPLNTKMKYRMGALP